MSTLANVLAKLREHETELRRLGVQHASVFGSTARGEARADSDVDILIDLEPDRQISVFEYVRLKLFIEALLGEGSDVVNQRNLKPLLRDSILHDAVDAF